MWLALGFFSAYCHRRRLASRGRGIPLDITHLTALDALTPRVEAIVADAHAGTPFLEEQPRVLVDRRDRPRVQPVVDHVAESRAPVATQSADERYEERVCCGPAETVLDVKQEQDQELLDPSDQVLPDPVLLQVPHDGRHTEPVRVVVAATNKVNPLSLIHI